MPDGQLNGAWGFESRNAQACLERAIKGLNKAIDGKKTLDIVHENLRAV